MAWTCSGDSNSALIENMWKNGLITDARVKEAFLKVHSYLMYQLNTNRPG
jgi:protein-L-isoaspartate(D-aspartate) O-methyltransferase